MVVRAAEAATAQTVEVHDDFRCPAPWHPLSLPEGWIGSVRSASGLSVSLPGWRYPVVFDLTAGQARYDNYGGRWGDQQCLDQFLQFYAVEKAKLAARQQGHSVVEQSLPDGSIRLTVHVGGATI